MDRSDAVAVQAKLLCIIAGMKLVDSMDGSPNWWAFQEEAGRIVDDIRKRFPTIADSSRPIGTKP